MNEYVAHCKKDEYDVYVGRPSKWGNPFEIGKDGNRKTVIDKYRSWVLTQPKLMEDIDELRSKILGCWCAPKACHAEILTNLANSDSRGQRKIDNGES